MSYKPFKMKGHTLPGINQRKADRTADGRPGSSALQKKSPYKNVEEGYNPDGSVDKNSERYKKAMANAEKSKARKSKENELRETMKAGGDDTARQAQRELMSKGSISMDEKRRRDAENKKKEGGKSPMKADIPEVTVTANKKPKGYYTVNGRKVEIVDGNDGAKFARTASGEMTSLSRAKKQGKLKFVREGGSAVKKYKSDAQRKAVHASKTEKSALKNYKKGYYGA